MTKRKAQNSFLVLTTLGVYLGLLMVGGAAPQVLAHSATTRIFEISDEIEAKDDLDTKPDETALAAENVDSGRFSEFANAYAEFVLEEYNDELKFAEKMRRECPGVCRLSYLRYFTTFAPTLKKFFKTSDYSGSLAWSGDTLQREMEIKYSPSRSELSGLEAAFTAKPTLEIVSSRSLDLIIQNSTVTVESKNRHLIIVTRLPRAGLDALLAKDAK